MSLSLAETGSMSDAPTFHAQPHGLLEGVPPEHWHEPVAYIRSLSRPIHSLRPTLFKRNADGSPMVGRNGAPIPYHAEELIDLKIREVGLKGTRIFADILAANLKFNVPDWLGVMAVRWQRDGVIGNPKFSMLPNTAVNDNMQPNLDLASLPMYCLSDVFQIHPRLFAEWQRYGTPLDLRIVGQVTTRMNEYNELQTLWGPPLQTAGLAIPGLLNSPHGSRVAMSGGLSWFNSGKTGQAIVGDISAMFAQLLANRKRGPYWLYVGINTGNYLQTTDYKTANAASSETIWEHIAKMPSISKLAIADFLPDDNTLSVVLMFQPDDETVDVLYGQAPAQLSWQTGPAGMQSRHFMMLSALVPRVIESQRNQSGICIATPSLSDVLTAPWANGSYTGTPY